MLVSDILKNKGSKVFVVSEDTPLSAAILTMHERKIGALVVEDANGRLTGMFSERRLSRPSRHGRTRRWSAR